MTILYIHHFCNYIFQFFCSSRRFFEDKLYAEALDPEMRVWPAELSDFDGGNLGNGKNMAGRFGRGSQMMVGYLNHVC